MIGFLFLTYDNIYNEKVWKEYFKGANQGEYKIFVHPKNINAIKNQELFKNCIVPERCETAWGKFSLVGAQRLLMKEALKTEKIKHVIIVSHNSLPLTSFRYLYDYLKDKGSLIGYGVSSVWEHTMRYDRLNNPNFPKNKFYIQGQWSILSREDAEILVNEGNHIKNIFGNMVIPDEHAYINYLTHYKNKNIENKRIAHIHWENGTPKIFDHLSNDYIKAAKQGGAFFIRKVNNNAKLDVNYLLS